ncbi:extracellular solute-binding protein [Marinilactibacillus kalidii]|uniref:extracellular solute-binding protein n=1 Tax=Marinilactibacillus kalidii TaxID=2820274 RepID=UPI001ABE041D|nr:extracellular solute-binding protein [Marinilactibacillus kalidii]
MNKWKKLACLLGVTASSLLVACGNNDAEEGGKEAASGGEDSFSIWSTWLEPSSTVEGPEESPFHQGLEEETGVELNWQFPTSGQDWSEAFNLMISDQDLPDLIYYSWMGLGEQHIQEGTIRDLTDVLEEKAPNYWQFLKDNPDFDRAMKTDDGKYYMFGFFREEPFQASYQGPQIRQDWLDEQGLPTPTNIEELTNTIKVFNEEYGAQLLFQTGWRMSPGFAGAFGARGSFETRYFVDESDQIQMAQTQPEWIEYMSWLNELYQDNLIDPDFSTIDDQGIQTKVAQDDAGITLMNAGSLLSFNKDAETNGTCAEWVGFGYPDQGDGSKSASIFSENLNNAFGIAISTSMPEEKMDKALEFLDWAYTEEGYNYWNYGREGESWEMVDGQPTFTEAITEHELGKDEAIILNTGNWQSGQGVQAARFVEQRLDVPSYEASIAWAEDQEEAIAAIVPTSISMTAEERREAANLENTINVYVAENSLKFVTGERSLDEFDAFVQELNDQGLDRLVEINQAAYDRYLQR